MKSSISRTAKASGATGQTINGGGEGATWFAWLVGAMPCAWARAGRRRARGGTPARIVALIAAESRSARLPRCGVPDRRESAGITPYEGRGFKPAVLWHSGARVALNKIIRKASRHCRIFISRHFRIFISDRVNQEKINIQER
ncbi:hypothetical protein [Achromobacter mucicolens]|uniref:hypothetical protein n=1 Tax=Achromobacter mucicolens TaxID=1389922 RepID=UPI0011B256CE|nr:hypothetical protein [Achromobacter mucicolens]